MYVCIYIRIHAHMHILMHNVLFSQLVLFGGWGDEWLDDLYGLDVSGIVGPPYAVQKLIPATGPISGKTRVSVRYLDCIVCVYVCMYVLYVSITCTCLMYVSV